MDGLGHPLEFSLSEGQASDLEGADYLLAGIEADIVLGDQGYDAEEWGKTVVIPPRRNRKHPREYDKEVYKARHLYTCGGAKP